MATTVNGSTRPNICVKINKQPARALIDSGANRVYIILMYVKRQGFALRRQKESYSLDISNGTPAVCNKKLVDQETYKLELKL